MKYHSINHFQELSNSHLKVSHPPSLNMCVCLITVTFYANLISTDNLTLQCYKCMIHSKITQKSCEKRQFEKITFKHLYKSLVVRQI